MTARPTFSLWDRLRVLVGVPLYVRFLSPDGDCHAACTIEAVVQRDWPDTDWPDDLRRWRAQAADAVDPAVLPDPGAPPPRDTLGFSS